MITGFVVVGFLFFFVFYASFYRWEVREKTLAGRPCVHWWQVKQSNLPKGLIRCCWLLRLPLMVSLAHNTLIERTDWAPRFWLVAFAVCFGTILHQHSVWRLSHSDIIELFFKEHSNYSARETSWSNTLFRENWYESPFGRGQGELYLILINQFFSGGSNRREQFSIRLHLQACNYIWRTVISFTITPISSLRQLFNLLHSQQSINYCSQWLQLNRS